jgi:hypothetical protein
MWRFLFVTACLLIHSTSVLSQLAIKPEGAPVHNNEKLVIAALNTIHGAEATYFATTGNGNYGSLLDLHHAHLIDATLATGEKHGYVFILSFTPSTTNKLAEYSISAIPREYSKTGGKSFYTTTDRDVRAVDKKGLPASLADPIVDVCSNGTIEDNERCLFGPLQTFHGAQMTYAATSGEGRYGSFAQLVRANLIPKSLVSGSIHGYSNRIITFRASGDRPPEFKIYAVPLNYGVTGVRSFFLGINGVIRGADKNGKPADESDVHALPCLKCSPAENEKAVIAALDGLWGAENEYFHRNNETRYASLHVLREENLIDRSLWSGFAYGYRFTVSVVELSSRQSAGFRICAIPTEYGEKGIRSFFVDESRVIRGADKKGECADQNDLKID